MAQTFPYGYERPPDGGQQGMGTMLTWDQMMLKATVRNLHPEVRRRFKALIEFAATQGVPLGVGTAWRVQPNPPPPGFAQPGNSWHESCPVSPLSSTALAIDTVPASSWDWMEAHCGAYGLRTFRAVNNEPWHIQPVEIPTSRRFATTMPPLTTWPLPGDKPNVPPTPPEEDDDMKYIHLTCSTDQTKPEVLYALDGEGAAFIGFASPTDRDQLVAAYLARRADVTPAQFDVMISAAQGQL
jgi:hypothetical protein